MRPLFVLVAAAAAIAAAGVGIVHGTYAAGGSDSSCYALMADAFVNGRLQPRSDLAPEVPWPNASRTFAPGGFLPGTELAAPSPICAPGFSLVLASFGVVGGLDAIFYVTPLAGALLVWLAFLVGDTLSGPLEGAMSAVLVAASPTILYQVVQPMNDIATAAMWTAVYAAILKRRWTVAGACCGLALVIRPNLLPLAAVCAASIFVRTPRPLVSGVLAFCAAVLPFGLVVLWLNHGLYGSPFRTGYGNPGNLFAIAAVPVNLSRYVQWLLETHTFFPLLGLAAPFLVVHERRGDVWLALLLIFVTFGIYLMYTPFDDWTYLRFLMPAIVLSIVLASVALVRGLARFLPANDALRRGRTLAVAAAFTLALAAFCVATAQDRLAFNLRYLEQRYRSAGSVVRDRLPAGAVVYSVWDSGAVRFHGRREALVWESLQPEWLDRSLQWLSDGGREPYLLLESWEEPLFRARFSGASDIGKLDWPPKYEIDRVVRIYDPRDRARYNRGERVETDYVWPLRQAQP